MKPIRFLQLGLLGAIWGSSYLFIKVAVEGIDPVTLVAGRLIIAALFLVTIVRLLGYTLPSRSRIWVHVTVMAVIGNVIPFTLIAWGEQHIASGLAAILNATTPLFTLLFAVAALRTEHFGVAKVFGLLIGFLGVGVLTGGGITDLQTASAQGQASLIVASICYGAAFAYARRFLRGTPMVLAAAQILMAAIITTPLALIVGDPLAADLTVLRVGAWLALGALSSGVAYILYYTLIGSVGAMVASFATYLTPIVGVTWGWLLLDEALGPRSLAGIALILTGVVFATNRLRRAPKIREETAVVAGHD